MWVIVCGGRSFNDRELVFETLDRIHAETPITHLIHGAATGADGLADAWAHKKNRYEVRVHVMRFHARWEDISSPKAVVKMRWDGVKYNAAAGIWRNLRMLETKPNLVVAFPGSTGTRHMTRSAEKAGIKVLYVQGRSHQ